MRNLQKVKSTSFAAKWTATISTNSSIIHFHLKSEISEKYHNVSLI